MTTDDIYDGTRLSSPPKGELIVFYYYFLLDNWNQFYNVI